jgi:ABC-type amino acid transport substrate-binding protein
MNKQIFSLQASAFILAFPDSASSEPLGLLRAVGKALAMRRRLWASIMTIVLLAVPHLTHAQQEPDRRVADLVRAGKVRIALFSGQYTKDPVTGELKGVWAEVARALAVRVGVHLVLVEHPTPPKMVECLKAGACDVGFLGYDPARAADVEGFSPPFIEFDYTYLVWCRPAHRSAAPPTRTGPDFALPWFRRTPRL